MSSPPDLGGLSPAELKALVIALLARVGELEHTVAALREKIARLKNVLPRPTIKRSGVEKAIHIKPASEAGQPRRGGGKKTARRIIHDGDCLEIGGAGGEAVDSRLFLVGAADGEKQSADVKKIDRPCMHWMVISLDRAIGWSIMPSGTMPDCGSALRSPKARPIFW
jgi:hypothetical protein